MTTYEFDTYFKKHRPKMVRFASAILHSMDDAEDVASEVMERLWRQHDTLGRYKNFDALVMTSTRNCAYDHIRKRRPSEEPNDSTRPPDDLEQRNDSQALVRFAISKLPDRQREIIHLREIEGYEISEIAQIFEIEESNTRMILSRSRTALREIIIKLM